MTRYSWTGTASTDFANAANWIDEDTGAPAGVPGATDTVYLDSVGEITGTGTVASLDVLPDGSHFTLDGGFSAKNVSDQGALTIMQAGLLARRISIGSSTSGGLLSIDQSSVGALDGRLDVGVGCNTTYGTAELDIGNPQEPAFGPGGTLALGQGVLSVGTGGLVVANGVITGGSQSAIMLSGDDGAGLLEAPDYAARITVGRLVIGDSGSGEADLSLGGTLLLGSGHGVALAIGVKNITDAPSKGSLQGTAVSATLDGTALVGEAGQGNLSLTNSSLTTLGGLIIGAQEGASGTVTLADVAWVDEGNVIVGASGSGSLAFTNSFEPSGPLGTATIDGSLRIGTGSGAGAVTLKGANLTVAGNTILGDASADTISITGGNWNNAGHAIHLAGAASGSPDAQGDTLSVNYGSLEAGFLYVGHADRLEAFNNGTLALGRSVSGTAAAIGGQLIVGEGSTLTALGNVSVASAFAFDGSEQNGLLLAGGAVNLEASGEYALSLRKGGNVTILSGSLTAQGGILAAGGDLLIEGGTVSASSSGLALDIASGGVVLLQSGQLDTAGVLAVDDGDRRTGQFQGGTLLVQSGAALDSMATTPNGLAVAIDGGSATIAAATWTVDGRFQVGAIGPGGTLTGHGAVINIDGALFVGGGLVSSGRISTDATDTILSGGTLSAGQTGIAASNIVVSGLNSSITTGTLDIGTAHTGGELSIINGAVITADTASLNGVLRLGFGSELNATTFDLAPNAAVLGTGTLNTGDIVVRGDITIAQGSLICLGPITGAGVLQLSDGTLDLGQNEAASVGISFGAAGTIVTPSIAALAGTLSGWQAGDAILFTGEKIASYSYANGTVSLFDGTHALLGTEYFSGGLFPSNFLLTPEGDSTLLSYQNPFK